jgi:hypothetical protein
MDTLATAIIPHPDPLPLSAPPGLVWFLLTLTFLLHLLPMNFILGGTIISTLLRRTPDSPRNELRDFLARAMPPMVAATVSFGVAPLLLTQVLYGRLFYSASILMGWFWLILIPLLILGYYGTYLVAFKGDRLGGTRSWVTGLAALCFTAIAFIYANVMSMMITPGRFGELHGGSAGGALNLADPTLLPRFLHMLLGALAVTGLVIAFYGARKLKTDENAGRYALRLGGHWFLTATVLNIGTGCWWLMALPRETMLMFMGGSPHATGVLMLGIVLGIVAMVLVEGSARTEKPQRRLCFGASLTILALVCMILARDQIRKAALDAVGYELPTWVEPAWGQLGIFIALLLLAVVTIVWMLRKLAIRG